ncbi:uncharacterized protein LOC115615784 isoform X2 [Strigops habroptila]|uniref:uncharacterized protein LOC115615784 isoform X2 n=1 Tax=Strigops habroptila TaxID=2489341 RepID=UPI001401DBFC|nr:uncharacterized protein LOC115615784 isoform X2 [Strigops habroptila]
MKGKHRHRPRIPGKQNPAELFLGNPLSSRQPRPRRVRNPPHWPLDQQTDRTRLSPALAPAAAPPPARHGTCWPCHRGSRRDRGSRTPHVCEGYPVRPGSCHRGYCTVIPRMPTGTLTPTRPHAATPCIPPIPLYRLYLTPK